MVFVELAWLVPILLLGSAALIAAAGKKMPLLGSEIGIAAVFVGWVISIGMAVHTFTNAPFDTYERAWRWAPLGDGLNLELGMFVDGLTAMMFVLVTTVSLMVHIYSREYMKGEERFTYYFSMLSLFTFSMLVCVIANNTLQAVVGWELVGLCSFLLIGFYWKEKPNQDAANKAFLTTKFADVGLIVGVIVLSTGVSGDLPFNINRTIDAALTGEMSNGIVVLGCLMIFLGAVGKSGQMPLHVWLPDAMAGPTPVSALIHAATMVTAGVFLIARLYPVFAQSLTVMTVIAVVGTITLFFAGFVAMVQDDIKKVLAYSTVSQLGYMMAALGVGGYTAGIFHLFTHGFFKALLFLGSGSLIHAVHSNNMSDMGGLRKKMPVTFVTFVIGSLALAGFPLTAGFFSKDEILVSAQLWAANGIWTGNLVYWAGLAGAMVTTFYMARAIFLIFFGEHRGAHHEPAHAMPVMAGGASDEKMDHEAHDDHHAEPHESGPQILLALVVLAALSFPVGFAGGFLWDEVGGDPHQNFETWTATHALEETTYPFIHVEDDGHDASEDDGHAAGLAPGTNAGGLVVAAAGGDGSKVSNHVLHGAPEFHVDVFVLALLGFLIALGGAFAIYGRGKPDEDPTMNMGPVSTLLINKYYLDDIGYAAVVVPVRDKLAKAASWSSNELIDAGIVRAAGGAVRRLSGVTYTVDQKIVDGGINGMAFSAAWWSDRLKRIQSGDVQRYAAALVAGTVVLIISFALVVS